MNEKSKYGRITISLSPKMDMAIRKNALAERITLSEMIERYREAWLREREAKKAKKAKKEQPTE